MVSVADDDFFHLFSAEGMGEEWQMTETDIPFWFAESDSAWSNVFLDPNPPSLTSDIPSPMEDLTMSMQEYFEAKSRAPSPSLKANKFWYGATPTLNDHNEDIVRVFSRTFRKHIPQTFTLFKEPTVSGKGRDAYTLALAAVGGLFCDVPGSSEVSKSMYNDARRLLLASVGQYSCQMCFADNAQFNRRPLDDTSAASEDKLTTFVLLALYGLCSGDKRSYEFTEAFHSHLMDSVRDYTRPSSFAASNPRSQGEITRVLEALYILDCYRVIIMQCPPSLGWHHPNSITTFSSPMDRISRLHHEEGIGSLRGKSSTLGNLASLSPFLWPVMYPRQNRYGNNNVSVESVSLWKGDFVELACDSWLRSQPQATASDLAIYHLMNIMLHANLTVIQSFVHSASDSAARDPKKSLAAMEIHAWTRSRHYQIAHWHAERMIAAVQEAFTAPSSRSEQSDIQAHIRASSGADPRHLSFEAPHVPYAVYFATLVIWCGDILNETIASTSSGQATIIRGERILSFHRVHVAQLLGRVLSEVK
ncbi:hypothetical protein H2200_007004 [Cladophialophora chaetospira]|uniref:Transcription factor domain-containing protein n=1 Tax=Cladophialophora chaetospira TaxID=386627 RepID=A0AA38X738_9EURO|nr:hypothetical protein H2200_007004 [Cladophialophora chaetospira]